MRRSLAPESTPFTTRKIEFPVVKIGFQEAQRSAEAYFDGWLKKSGLSNEQIARQTLDELEQSLERVNDAINNQESFGKAKLVLTGEVGLFALGKATSDATYEVGILPILLEKKKLILDRTNVLKNKEKIKNLRDAIKKVGDKDIREKLENELNNLESEAKNLKRQAEDVEKEQSQEQLRVVEALARLNEASVSQLNIINSYYNSVLQQAQQSFRWALIAAGIGLAFFILAVGFLLLQKPDQLSTISLISGVVIEFISGINFYLYGRASQQLAAFHTRLDRMQRFFLANNISQSIDGKEKNAALAELIRLIGSADSGSLYENPKDKEKDKS